MSDKTIGVVVSGPDTAAVLDNIQKAEAMGIDAVWLTSGGSEGDALTLLAAAAARTERILLGTSIVPSWTRHPITASEQVQVIANLAPGRFRLGVGPSDRQEMERTFGADFRAPLGHLREYLQILRGLLQHGSIDFDGHYYVAHATLPEQLQVPVMASALGPGAFELCGAEADGAISWVCPHHYLREVALTAMQTGAERAGRSTPPLITHAPVCVHEDTSAVRNAVRQQMGYFPQSTFYARMFATAGFPDSGPCWTRL